MKLWDAIEKAICSNKNIRYWKWDKWRYIYYEHGVGWRDQHGQKITEDCASYFDIGSGWELQPDSPQEREGDVNQENNIDYLIRDLEAEIASYLTDQYLLKTHNGEFQYKINKKILNCIKSLTKKQGE